MKNKAGLLACPFCSFDNVVHQTIDRYLINWYTKHWIECDFCHITTPEYNNKEDAYMHWNWRDIRK